ncbi:hypothetical protein PHISCL_01508 [Aspergillus sclerotialis]|uniref:cellulase n=1 Tax=Aspergillus sclerotialis TaxID=2070753 RepID=A0A3A2ZSN5_9EURO|nr:hypothetical protein PHISCL_01508 [Aspergillus sclerotialis]
MFLQKLAVGLSFVSASIAEIIYAGFNEAGGEFNPSVLPGTYGKDYAFIDKDHVQYYIDHGVNTFRVTLLMERMCPLEYGLGSKFNETYFSLYKEAVDYITTHGSYALIDPHNYMRYNNASDQPYSGSVIGNSSDPNAATTEQFAGFWRELASRFRYNPNVLFGINNEPHNMTTELILHNDQAAMDAIRSTGASQLVLVPGNGFTNAEIWTNLTGNGLELGSTPSSEIMGKIYDPIDNWAFDMHLYMDYDFSGTHDQCVGVNFGVENLVLVTEWLEKHNFKAFLSEFGAGYNKVCYEALDNTITYLENRSPWIGWTYWAAGPIWWNNNGVPTDSAEPYKGKGFKTTWPIVLEPHVRSYQPMKRFGITSNFKNKCV